MLLYLEILLRKLSQSAPEKLTNEINKICDIPRNNGYKENIINALIMNMNIKKKRNLNEQNSKSSTLESFLGFFERLTYKLNKVNISLTAKPSIKLKRLFCKKMDPIGTDYLSGVYEITFTKYDGTLQCYIGMTKRKFKMRIEEHTTDIKYNKKNI